MTHGPPCANARTKRNRCRCQCQGAQHGLAANREMVALGQRAMTEDMGGEVAQILRETRGAVIPAGAFCAHENVVAWVGYPHDGGVPDAAGNKWWMTVPCEECHYEASWWKVQARLKAIAARVPAEASA